MNVNKAIAKKRKNLKNEKNRRSGVSGINEQHPPSSNLSEQKAIFIIYVY
jgi:hypothetical protein